MQVEYTQMATYGGEMLVEHDVTFDLHQQVVAIGKPYERRRGGTSGAGIRFENDAVARYPRVIVMSDKDASAAWTTPRMFA